MPPTYIFDEDELRLATMAYQQVHEKIDGSVPSTLVANMLLNIIAGGEDNEERLVRRALARLEWYGATTKMVSDRKPD